MKNQPSMENPTNITKEPINDVSINDVTIKEELSEGVSGIKETVAGIQEQLEMKKLEEFSEYLDGEFQKVKQELREEIVEACPDCGL